MPNPNNYPFDDRNSYPDDRYAGRDDRGYGDPRGADPEPEGAGPGPEGEFPIAAVKHAFGKAKTKTLQIGVRIMITEGEHKGKTALWYGAFTPDAEPLTLRGMKALGHIGDDIFDCRGFYNPDGSMKTQTAAIGVFKNSRDQQGRMRWRCEFINGGDVVMAEELSANEAAAFRERMRAKLSGRGAPSGGSQRGSAPPPPRDDRRAAPRDDRQPPPRDDRQPARDDRRPPPPADGDMPWGNDRGNGRW